MSWNYRVVAREFVNDESVTSLTEVQMGIYTAYYASETDDTPHSISSEPASPAGETLDELREDLLKMRQALEKPVLDFATFDMAPEGTPRQSTTGQDFDSKTTGGD